MWDWACECQATSYKVPRAGWRGLWQQPTRLVCHWDVHPSLMMFFIFNAYYNNSSFWYICYLRFCKLCLETTLKHLWLLMTCWLVPGTWGNVLINICLKISVICGVFYYQLWEITIVLSCPNYKYKISIFIRMIVEELVFSFCFKFNRFKHVLNHIQFWLLNLNQWTDLNWQLTTELLSIDISSLM